MVKLLLLVLPLWACNPSTSESTKHEPKMIQLKEERQIRSVDCCLDSILKQIDASLVITASPVEISVRGSKLKVDTGKKITLSSGEIKAWLEEQAIIDSIKSYRLVANNEFYLLSSPINQATGLAVNFTAWLVIDASNNLSFEFRSLSENHQAFYFEKATDELHFVSFTFSESFVHQKDFDNIMYNIENYTIKEGKRLIKEKESRCSCY